LITAALWHDRGKDRKRWQGAIFNETKTILAKAGPRGMNPRVLGGYRHEFGSLLEATADVRVCSHPEADLILHLIAAHHGRTRPHFEPDAWDTERYTTFQNEQQSQEVMRRFSRLQQRFGRWGLTWLESLLRCADALASRQAVENSASPQSKETQE
jgi:CRISPR-associated endonuclease/helicase Cas3